MITRAPIDAVLLAARVEDFPSWQVKAAAGTTQACACEGRGYSYDPKIYGALKPALKARFDSKCAYCEAIFDHVAFGDVEHFRPKKRVDEDDAATHPGYFWLAYDPSNLLPACEMCNRPAKKNRFPIAGPRAASPADDITKEGPLLLNPYNAPDFDPAPAPVAETNGLVIACTSIHLGFSFEFDDNILTPTGVMSGRTDRGKCSIEVYNLNRPQLVRHRRKLQEAAIDRLENRYFRMRLDQLTQDLSSPTHDSSAAVRATILAWRWLQQRRLGAIQ